ncbi:hypothetical protein QQ045_000717 [Rhodiola kirilowii]
MILEKLNSEGVVIKEGFASFNRVSIRRLGRLLPDARWPWLPFMDLRQKKGERAQILKRCCMRVKCFVDTDGGFNPTRSKSDLVHHHAFTTVLKSFGDKSLDKDKEVSVDISRNGKKLSISRLQKEYLEWICNMHGAYDDENECGEDQPVVVVTPNKKQLGVSSDVVRVHQEIQKNGTVWKSGQKIKILKGACAGCHNNNVYPREYLVLEVEAWSSQEGGLLEGRHQLDEAYANNRRLMCSFLCSLLQDPCFASLSFFLFEALCCVCNVLVYWCCRWHSLLGDLVSFVVEL